MKLSLSERFRALVQDPAEEVRKMGVSEGMSVADVGAGLGYFTIPSAVIVGQSGVVYSIEPDPRRSARIQERVKSEGLHNVRVLMTGAEHLDAVPAGTVDTAFSAFTLHHFVDREAAFGQVSRLLKAGGTFYIWDRVPGAFVRHGTRAEELKRSLPGFSRFELLSSGRSVRARYTK
jgi:ubiquinone/menaquinone biosynthesis C-methylase UbiE